MRRFSHTVRFVALGPEEEMLGRRPSWQSSWLKLRNELESCFLSLLMPNR